MLCDFCKNLSINLLIGLAEVEFSARSFPQHAYYQHHSSYANLLASAESGCHLCDLICRGFKQTITPKSASFWEGHTWDHVILQKESVGEASDIKVCINADHLYVHQGLEDVRLFDVLLIQAGRPQPIYDPEQSEDDDTYLEPLTLSLNIFPGEATRAGKYRVGRLRSDPRLDSPYNYSIAKRWITECCSVHEACPGNETVQLPTRVIDVGGLNDQCSPRLVISNGARAKYTALSHCWGGEISPLLTLTSLKPFQDAIPEPELPANFRDAIAITRALGLQYIWIDSLCIIQDSSDDWNAESKMMGSIYKNALVTISAAMSRQSRDGIFGIMSSPSEAKELGTWRLPIGNSSTETVQLSFKNEDEENLGEVFFISPLAQRAWTLQERVLSPRTLYYGKEQIYWECLQGFQAADGVPEGTLMPDHWAYRYRAISSLLHSGMSNEKSVDKALILEDYYQLVHGYSARKLTLNSDKLPAFSGLAAAVHCVLGGKYLAGLWSMDFRQGLLWHAELGQCRHVLSNQAPSWSWAVTNDPIIFHGSPSKIRASPHDAELIDGNVICTSQNEYGQVVSGYLVIKGLTMKLFRSRQLINYLSDGVARLHYDEPGADTLPKSYGVGVFQLKYELGHCLFSVRRPDDREHGKELEVDDVDVHDLISSEEFVVLMIEAATRLDDGQVVVQASCLLLMEVPNSEEPKYTRAGLLVVSVMYENDFEAWVHSYWERKTVHII